MSNVLRVLGRGLGGLATAVGKGYEGYGIDKRERVKNALIQAKEAKDAERDRVNDLLLQGREARDIEGDRLRNAVTQRTLDTPVAVLRDPIADDATKYAARRQIDINNPLPIRATSPTGETPAQKLSAIRGAESKVGGLRREFQGVLNRRPKQSQFTDPLSHTEPDTTAFNESITNFRADSTETAGSLKAAQDELAGLRGNPASGPDAPPPTQPAIPNDGFATLAEQYKAALARNVDPVAAKKIYDESVAALSRSSGMMK